MKSKAPLNCSSYVVWQVLAVLLVAGCGGDQMEAMDIESEASDQQIESVVALENTSAPIDTANELYLMLGGTIYFFESTVEFRNTRLLPLVNPPVSVPGEYDLALFSHDASVIYQTSFAVDSASTATGGNFNLAIPLPEKTIERVEVSHRGSLLGSRTGSNSAPVVEVISPVGGAVLSDNAVVNWESSDADGNELSHYVYFSADGGGSWSNLVSNGKGNMLQLLPDNVVPTESAMLIISVTDGLNAAYVKSDIFRIR